MTIDDALLLIGASPHCWIMWHAKTGEVLRVENFAAQPSPIEMAKCLQSLQTIGSPVKGRFVASEIATKAFLENQAASLAVVKGRVGILTEWARMSVDELLGLLEQSSFIEPMVARDAYIIVEHLWDGHRDELTPPIQQRLESVLIARKLHDDAQRKLRIFLAAIRHDENMLKRLWKREIPGQQTWGDKTALMEAFAYVRTSDQEIIHDILTVFEMGIPFGGKFDAMINLGRIGVSAGESAANVIRIHVHVSEPYIIAARDRVLERLTTPDEEWLKCGHCCYGNVHDAKSHGVKSCSYCLGIGFVR